MCSSVPESDSKGNKKKQKIVRKNDPMIDVFNWFRKTKKQIIKTQINNYLLKKLFE